MNILSGMNGKEYLFRIGAAWRFSILIDASDEKKGRCQNDESADTEYDNQFFQDPAFAFWVIRLFHP